MEKRSRSSNKKDIDHVHNACYCALAVFVIALVISTILYFKSENQTSVANYFQLVAALVSITSMLLVLLQVISFVNDYKSRNTRSQKEYSANLAKEYAEEIIPEFSFIRNVMFYHFGEDKMITLNNIDPKCFDKNESDQILNREYFLPFEPGAENIRYETIERYIYFSNVFNKDMCANYDNEKKERTYNDKFRIVVTLTLNKIEAFSMILVEGLADEKMLYPSLHQSYLRMVKLLYPHIASANISVEDKYYKNIICLYKLWNHRNIKEREEVNSILSKK